MKDKQKGGIVTPETPAILPTEVVTPKVEETTPVVEVTEPVRPLIFERMAKVMADCPEIGKDMTNSSQGFKFRGIDQFYDALHPIMAKHQVFSTSKIVQMNETIHETNKVDYKTKQEYVQRMFSVSGIIGYTFWTIDGSSIYTEVMTKGMDMGDKETNKAMSIAHKYALIQVFAIATNEPDPDGESPNANDEVLPPKPAPKAPLNVKKPAPKPPVKPKEEAPTFASERDVKTIKAMLDSKIDKDKQAKWLEDMAVKSLETLPAQRAKRMIEFLINLPNKKGIEAPKEEVAPEAPETPVEPKAEEKTEEEKRADAIKDIEDMGTVVPNVGEGK